MIPVSSEAARLREKSRRPDGTFGTQPAGKTGVSIPVQTDPPPRHFAARLAGAVAAQAEMLADGGEGACLVSCAVLARIMVEHDVPGEVVRGQFNGQDHWWIESEGVRVDPTRGQFDDGPAVTSLDDPDPTYRELSRFRLGWTTDDLVVAEANRAFVFPGASQMWTKQALAVVREAAGVELDRDQRASQARSWSSPSSGGADPV